MGKVRFEDQENESQDPQVEAWIIGMMQEINAKGSPKEPEPSSQTVENGDDADGDVFYEIPLFDLEEEASWTDKRNVLATEITRLVPKIGHADKLGETVPNGPYKAQFENVKTKFSDFVHVLGAQHSALSSKGADEGKVEKLEAGILEAYTLYGDVELLAHKANKSMDEILTGLRAQSAKLNSELEILYGERTALVKSDVNVDEVDKAYAIAREALRDVNTGINIPKPEMAEEALDRTQSRKNDLAAAVRAGKRDADSRLNATMLKLSLVERDVSKTAENRGVVEDSKLFLKWFDVEHEAAQKALSQANSAVQKADYVGVEKFITEAEDHQANMQRFVLRKILNPDLGDETDDSIDETKLKDPEQKLLFKETTTIRRQAEQIFKDKSKVEAGGSNVKQFEHEFKNVMSLTKNAQTDLIHGENQNAAAKNDKARSSLKKLEEIRQETVSATNIAFDQVEQLKIAAKPAYDLFPELQALAQENEQYQRSFKRFSKQMTDFDFFVKTAEHHVQAGELVAADGQITQARRPLNNLMFRVQDFVQFTPEQDQGGAAGKLAKKIAMLRADYDKLAAHTGDFTDNEELKIFENFSQKTKQFLDDADEAIGANKVEEAADHKENAQIALDGMVVAFERGVDTSAKVNLFMADIVEAQSKIAALYERRREIAYDRQAADFLSYNTAAGEIVFEAEALLNAGRVKDAREILAQLPLALANMEACFVKPKGLRKGKKATPESYEPASVPQPEDPADLNVSEALVRDDDTSQKTLVKLLANLAKLQKGLNEAEAKWRTTLENEVLVEFDGILKEAKQLTADALDIAERDTEDEDEVIPDLQLALTSAYTLYGQLQSIFKTKSTKSVDGGKTEVLDPPIFDQEERKVIRILNDMKRLREGIERANLIWSPNLMPEKISDMNAAHQSTLQSLDKAEGLADQDDVQAFEILPQLKVFMTEAKAGLTLMQKIFKTSEEIKENLLKSLKDSISYHQSRFDIGIAKLNEAVDWGVDLTETEAAHSKGTAAVTGLKTAVMNRDVEVAKLQVDAIEGAISELNTAVEGVLTGLQDLRSQYSLNVTDLSTRYSLLGSRADSLLGNETELKKFMESDKLANNLLKTASQMVETSTQLDCDTHLDDIESTLDLMEAILTLNGDLGLEPEEKKVEPSESDKLIARIAKARQELLSVYHLRNEVEHIAEADPVARKHLKQLDTAYNAAEETLTSLETGKAVDPGRSFEVIDVQIQVMKTSLDEIKAVAARNPEAAAETEDQKTTIFASRIGTLRDELTTMSDQVNEFKDPYERETFEQLVSELSEIIKDLQICLINRDFTGCEKLLLKGQTRIDKGKKLYKLGRFTAQEFERLKEFYSISVETLKQLSEKQNTLKSQKKLNLFQAQHEKARQGLSHIQASIKADRVKEARGDVANVEKALAALQDLFKSKREKLKETFTRKKVKK
ncbi:hypothetical protein PsAD46_03728 [Pseudovibrio sp. Ad46]|uniref:hypothetical protein n=1 Tax=unclassified Pseudovibrio TaxID=2627060 RepID=UPI0007AE89C7|nr:MULTISPECIES: hypothetical protein [unclassified Pseudovibrio]KZK81595.1 hypothetical protein PsAD46_03728 [Pseudovibrio sp. Ad46]KZK94831.1 hypothetical protein PsAD5_02927 [Pseudovibrio sp. Ad5]